MDLLSTLLSFLLLLLLFLFISHFTLPAPPYYGPKSHPIIGSLIPFYENRHRLLDWYTSLLAGSPTQTFVIGRLGARRTVVTANPDNIEHILKTNFPNYPKGKPFTDILGDLLGRGIFNSDGDQWLAQRKLASHEFTARSLRDLLVSALDTEADGRLIPVLTSACCERRPVDLQDLFRRFAFDVICNISLGTDPGFLDVSLPELPFVNAFDAASMVSARRGAEPVSAVWKAKRAFGIGSERQLEEAVGSIHEYINDIIRQRKEENTKLLAEPHKEGRRNDLLSRLIAGGNSDEAIRDMVISFVMAGRDTTSAALTWFFWLVTCHPDIEAELLIEVMEVTRSKERKVDYESLKEMKYLEACLCETMRLFPPVVWDSKHADNADVLPDGTRVRKGDRVTYFPYGMGRMESIWGKDCMEFRPERWMAVEEGGGKELLRVSPYKYPVFQAGPRVCLGKDMAFVQMKYVAAAVLSRFKITREGQLHTPVLVPLLTAHMAGGLKVVLAERRCESFCLS